MNQRDNHLDLDEFRPLEALPEDSSESFNPERRRITTTVDQLGPDEPPTVQGTMSMDAVAVAHLPPLEYEFVRVLGRGGLGEVWEARQLSLGRSVALKRLKSDTYKKVSRNESVKAMLSQGMQAEAVTTAILDHPNIVPVHDFTRDHDGRPMISMKLVRGEPWDIIMKRDWDRLSPTEFLQKHIPVLIGMSQAVAFAHSRGIMHRDLKPAQVMVGEYDEVLLMDWGLAIAFDERKVAHFGTSAYIGLMPTTDTASNPAGTVAYMAPEQTDPETKHLGPWTDVYLLGSTLYQVLTGKVPHPGSRIEAFKHAQTGRVFPVDIAVPDRPVPEDLVRLMENAMEPDYRRRMLTASDFVARLKAWLALSNQRMEGLTLRDQVTRQIRRLTDDSDYRDFTEQLVLLRRLQYLLPDDAGVRELESDLSARFAVVAARRGDIGLARLQASLVPDDRRRDVVSHEIERRAQIQAVQDRQRRVFLIGFITLVFVALTSIVYLTTQITLEEKRRQEVETEKARFEREQRGRARHFAALRELALVASDRTVDSERLASEAARIVKSGLTGPEQAEVFVHLSNAAGADAGEASVAFKFGNGGALVVHPAVAAGAPADPDLPSADQEFLRTAAEVLSRAFSGGGK